jgi:hypothetical protein
VKIGKKKKKKKKISRIAFYPGRKHAIPQGKKAKDSKIYVGFHKH